MSKIIGIDLGTTYSAIAELDDLGNPEVLASTDSNKKITASVVYIKDKNVIVGDKALDALTATPKNVATETKRQMENDVVYPIEKGQWVDKDESNSTSYSPAQISSFILSKLKSYTSDVKKAVITVPALFAEKARVATLDAAKMAGIEVISLINEPTAAACYYASLSNVKKITGKILVFDLGGGTFDVTVCDVQKQNIEVITSRGDKWLGGKDFDSEIVNLMNSKYKTATGQELDIENKKPAYMEIAEQNLLDEGVDKEKIKVTRKEFAPESQEYKVLAVLEKFLQRHQRFGVRSKKGFYDYQNDSKTLSELTRSFEKEREKENPISLNDIKNRLMNIQLVETMKCFEEGILNTAYEGDVASILGWGFPPETGGIVSNCHKLGNEQLLEELNKMTIKWGERYQAPKILKTLINKNFDTLHEAREILASAFLEES